MQISLCVGNYAETPYKISGLEILVYSIEELCFCMKENAILLDNSIMEDSLADWIGGDLGLKDLARELYPLIHKRGSLSSFVSIIMEYAGFYDANVIRGVEQQLKQGAGLSGIEKKKTQIDYLMEKHKFAAALKGYDSLLLLWNELEQEGRELPAPYVKGALLHNKGVALARLMVYEPAGDAFMEAYDITGDAEEYIAYLGTRRMLYNDTDYISFVADHPECYEYTLELEKRMDAFREDFLNSPQYERICLRKDARRGNEKQSYYDDNENLTMALKQEYRDCVVE